MVYQPPHRRKASASAQAEAEAEAAAEQALQMAPAPAQKTHPYAAQQRTGGNRSFRCPTARRPLGANSAGLPSATGSAPNGAHAILVHHPPYRRSTSSPSPHAQQGAGDTPPPDTTNPGRRGGPDPLKKEPPQNRPTLPRAPTSKSYAFGISGVNFLAQGGSDGRSNSSGSGTSATSQRSQASASSIAGSARRGTALHRARMIPRPSQMELLASVSRSGGIDPDGDALKNHATQDRFRVYIDEKIAQYHSTRGDGAEQDALRNIVLLFRKLREGVVASARHDQFAIAVFEDSVRYAVLAHDVPQLNAALHGLVPGLYRAVDAARAQRAAAAAEDKPEPSDEKKEEEEEETAASWEDEYTQRAPVLCVADNRVHFVSLLLLYHLVHSSRETYQATLDSLTTPPRGLFVEPAPAALATSDDSAGGDDTSVDPAPLPRRTRLVRGPDGGRAFVRATSLRFAQEAARTLADETFSPLAFRALVAGTSDAAPRTAAAEAPEALERALLAWATPKVRERASQRIRKSYRSATVPWVAHRLGIKEEAVHIWALAQGLRVQDGVVLLK